MDLSSFTVEELLLVAIKSEIESEKIYRETGNRVKNAFLKDRFNFLAGEEKNHESILRKFYKKEFGDKEIIIPEKSSVPLPEVKVNTESDPISEILEQSMKAELAAKEFYEDLAKKFSDAETKNILKILSRMEQEHYNILNTEYENAKLFEDYDEIFPNAHMGA